MTTIKENVFDVDQMGIVLGALIYTHVRKQKAFIKQREIDPNCGRACALEKAANETLALLTHISENSDQATRDYIHEQLKLVLG